MCSIYFSIFSMPKKYAHHTHTHSLWLTHTHNLLIITHIHVQHDHHYITHIYTLYTHQLWWGRGRIECWHTACVNDGGEAGGVWWARGEDGGVQYVLHTNAKINCLSSSGRWNYRDASSFMHIWESKDFETSYTFLRSFNHAINYCLTWCMRFGGTTVGWL